MSHFFDQFPATGYICAHRGARSIAPENTWLAMEQARCCGSDLLETDVQMTADGELVLCHDTTLQRTTDIAERSEFSGRSWNVIDLTATELATLDAGSWFLPTDPFGTVAAGVVTKESFSRIRKQRIPLLCDLLNDCQKHNFPLNLEIKDQTGAVADTLIVGKVLDCLNTMGSEDLVLISSFNHDYLRQVKQLNPVIATAALVEDRHPPNLLAYLHDLNVDAYHPDQLITDAKLVKQLTNAGMRVSLWTVNELEQARYFSVAGATFIYTDWPQKMVGGGHST